MAKRQARESQRIACVALTAAGLRHAQRVRSALPQRVDVYASARAMTGVAAGEAERFDYLAETLAALWESHDGLVLFFALGAAVRLIAPLLRDKHTDPAVVVVDDRGRFAISVVSGHIGGANALAEACAVALDAVPVITTASDVTGALAVDLLGRAYGWRIEPSSHVTAVAAAMANGERIALAQDAGERDWLPPDQPLPAHVTLLPMATALLASSFAGMILITDRVIAEAPAGIPTVVYRPRSLVVGMGCRRGVTVERLENLLQTALAAQHLSPLSVGAFATASIKGDEPGLLALAERYDAPLLTYSAEALALVATPTPSERVRALVGTPSVSEAAALLASEGGPLLASKRKGEGCTVAIARHAQRQAQTPLIAGAARDYSLVGGA